MSQPTSTFSLLLAGFVLDAFARFDDGRGTVADVDEDVDRLRSGSAR